jgi:hypothetical protein
MSSEPPRSPHFLKYQELGWLDHALPEKRELFNLSIVQKICRACGADPEIDANALAAELRSIGDAYWTAAMSSPLGLDGGPESQSSDERRRKIAAGIIHPAERLISSLSDGQIATLSEWPESFSAPDPDRHVLLEQLGRLVRRMRDLSEVLEDKKRKGSPLLTEFKIDLANALSDVFERYFPGVSAARGGFDRTNTPSSAFHWFLNLCSKEIFGGYFSLSGDILDEVAKLRGNR